MCSCARCDARLALTREQVSLFQSSSGVATGCTLLGVDAVAVLQRVSIRIRQGRRMRHAEHQRGGQHQGVSILILQGGQMRARMPDSGCAWHVFQSSCGMATGCNDRYPDRAGSRPPVSILIRRRGRTRRECTVRARRHRAGFNPHLAGRPDATHAGVVLKSPMTGFNPHPAGRPDATRRPDDTR